MKILFFVYPWAFQSPGGGEIMLLKTKEALQDKGISVKLFNQWEDKLNDFDILHIFGSVKDCLGLMQAARSLRIKIVLSPIFWTTFQRAWFEYGGLADRIQKVCRHTAKLICPVLSSDRRRMLQIADIILPNSQLEAKQIAELFCISRDKMHIVPLAADVRFAQADRVEFINKYKLEDFILSVGRIEPRKNQLNLIKALKHTGKNLVLIGDPVLGCEDYFNECKRWGDDFTLFINRIEHSNSLLASAYAACGVFVLPGWFETPGLVALEAGLAGANRLAVTKGGSTLEYFKGYVEYFNPANPRSIRESVLKALNNPRTEGLKQHILANFLWPHAAEENIKAYHRLLK